MESWSWMSGLTLTEFPLLLALAVQVDMVKLYLFRWLILGKTDRFYLIFSFSWNYFSFSLKLILDFCSFICFKILRLSLSICIFFCWIYFAEWPPWSRTLSFSKMPFSFFSLIFFLVRLLVEISCYLNLAFKTSPASRARSCGFGLSLLRPRNPNYKELSISIILPYRRLFSMLTSRLYYFFLGLICSLSKFDVFGENWWSLAEPTEGSLVRDWEFLKTESFFIIFSTRRRLRSYFWFSNRLCPS